MSFKVLVEHYLVFLGLKGGCTGSSESTLIKIPHCGKSHVAAHLCLLSHLRVSVFAFILRYTCKYKHLTTIIRNKEHQFGTEYCSYLGIKYEYCATDWN